MSLDVLARERARFSHALLVFDLEGSGAQEQLTTEDLESELDKKLRLHWGPHAKAIVIAPEIPARLQPVAWDIGTRKTGSANIAPTATQPIKPPAATITQR